MENSADPKFIRHFFEALRAISVLDPTCGSGAFLFAALNILEPLYEACIGRMTGFVETEAGKHKIFEDWLTKIAAHPNREYFIYKSIILNNLYGVDLMKEAVEIAKLRLFLKLAAVVDVDYKKPNLGLEPLPDIDFNVRAGNTLAGFASLKEIKAAKSGEQLGFDFDNDIPHIEEQAEQVSMAYRRFKDAQLINDKGEDSFHDAKRELEKRLQSLNTELDRYLAKSYGVDLNKPENFVQWKESHQPFHWFSEFFGIVHENGGFDVVIGNPPYVEYSKVKRIYSVKNYKTLACGDLYAFVTESACKICAIKGYVGLIVPISMFCTDGFSSLQSISIESLMNIYVSFFSNRPSQLFEGAQKRITIILGQKRSHEHKAETSNIYTTEYIRFQKNERNSLFSSRLNYLSRNSRFKLFPTSLEKVGCMLQHSIFEKLSDRNESLRLSIQTQSSHVVYYTRKFGYFLAFLDFIPAITCIGTDKSQLPSELKSLSFSSKKSALAAIGVLSSSTFFYFWNLLSDCRNLNKRDILEFPLNVDKLSKSDMDSLSRIAEKYLNDLNDTSTRMTKSGLYIQTFHYATCKKYIDNLDIALAGIFDFTDEELDFIINYDIKYRMGKDLNPERKG